MEYGDVEKKTYATAAVVTEIGMEFIENQKSRWAVESKFRLQYNFEDIPFIQKYDYTFLLLLGFIL